MTRLIVGAILSVSTVVLAACSGDPTESLRNGITQVNAAPTQLFVEQGRSKNVDVTATDEQGNKVATVFDTANVGPGISVHRDLTFQPVYSNDSTLVAPTIATQFRFVVTANEAMASSFSIVADGKTVDIPVRVIPDPALVPAASVATSGPSAADTITLTLPAPFGFQGTASVAFDVPGAVVVGRSADARTLRILAPPGTASTGAISGVFIDYLPTLPLASVTTDAVTLDQTVSSLPQTDDPATAPEIVTPALGEQSGFIDGGGFTGADLSADGGVAAQYYKFTVTEAGDYTFRINWGNDADIDFAVCSDVTCSDGGSFPEDETFVDQPEVGTLTLAAGTYYFDAILFDVGASGVAPPWISVNIAAQPSAE